MTYFLYGTPGSLYTGKARAYLIQQGIDFVERAAGEIRFREEIVPKIGRWIIPVLETGEGTLIQDGSDIIEHFENAGPTRFPACPALARHRLIAHIFELFGGEGLLRPAMHYRWNFDDCNRRFLEHDFPNSLAPTGAPDDVKAGLFLMASTRMRKAMVSFGVTPETIPTIEASYLQFLQLFNAHLASSPFLLGGRPTLGDYGLIAPLYAHLARDPYPSQIMKIQAHRVWRWVERMNAAYSDTGEYGIVAPELFADDAVPPTLLSLLSFIAEDYLPEIEAFVGFTNQWLAQNPTIETGTNGLPRVQDRVIGQVEFPWRGHTLCVAVMPYRVYLLQKIQDIFDRADALEQKDMQDLLSSTGLTALLNLRVTCRVERIRNLEVWGEHIAA